MMDTSILKRNIWYPSNRQVLFAILFVTLICCGILILLQPFGVNNYDPSESVSIELLVGVGSLALAMVLAFIVNEFLIRPFVIHNYTVKHVGLWLVWTIILGGSVSYINYNFLGGWHDWSIPAYFDFVKNWFILMALPLTLVLLYFNQYTLHLKLQEAQIDEVNSNQLFIFTSENQKDTLALPVEDILFLESQDNYVSLNYLSEGKINRHLLRSTLKRMEDELVDTPILRCHRSFLVNTDNVVSFKGNTHRLELRVKGAPDIIPVSRKYTSSISELLEGNS